MTNIWTGGGRYASSYAACANGNFYSWGYNGYGQLGLSNTTNRHVPAMHPMSNITAVAAVSTGNSDYPQVHSLLLDNQGKVYAAGYNGDGQCGVGHSTYLTDHTLVNLPQGVQGTIVEIQTMGYLNQTGSAMRDGNGQVWVCGYGGGHMLGIDPSNATSSYLPMRVMF